MDAARRSLRHLRRHSLVSEGDEESLVGSLTPRSERPTLGRTSLDRASLQNESPLQHPHPVPGALQPPPLASPGGSAGPGQWRNGRQLWQAARGGLGERRVLQRCSCRTPAWCRASNPISDRRFRFCSGHASPSIPHAISLQACKGLSEVMDRR